MTAKGPQPPVKPDDRPAAADRPERPWRTEGRRITDECYAEARRLIRENRGKLDAIVARLLDQESLDEPEIYAAAGIPRPPVTPTPAPVPA